MKLRRDEVTIDHTALEIPLPGIPGGYDLPVRIIPDNRLSLSMLEGMGVLKHIDVELARCATDETAEHLIDRIMQQGRKRFKPEIKNERSG